MLNALAGITHLKKYPGKLIGPLLKAIENPGCVQPLVASGTSKSNVDQRLFPRKRYP